MLQLPRSTFNRVTTAGFTRTISSALAAIVIVGLAIVADAFNDRLAADTVALTQKNEQIITPREPRSDSATYAQVVWPFNELFGSQKNRRDYYIPSRDMFGNPGPTYRVLGVVSSKPKNRSLTGADQLRLEVAKKLRLAPAVPPTTGPLLLAVSITKQTVTVFDAGVAVYKSPVSTGTALHPTPTGVFSIVEKDWWHRSNLYSLAPMPLMQRITWSGVALHAGELPGYAASHGCVRLPYDFAVRLWGTTKIGARVIITNDEVAPIEIAHARLFVPKAKAEPAPEPTPEQNIAPERITPPQKKPPSEDAPVSENAPAVPNKTDQALEIATWNGQSPGSVASDPTIPLPSVDADARPSVIVFADARVQSVGGAGDDDAANQDDSITEALQRIELIDPDNTVINGTVEIAVVRPGSPPETFLVSVEKVVDQLGQLPLVSEPSVMLASMDGSAVPIPSHANSKTRLAGEPAALPVLAPEQRVLHPGPVSVLVSRKDRRMYVRKGFEPLFDVPITVAKSDQPIGTHVFTAVALGDDQATMRWMVVSLSTASLRVEPGQTVEMHAMPGKRLQTLESMTSTAKSTVAAATALDRLDLPREAVERISELMSVGASLIVTDSGLGRDATALDSDFTILTR